MARIRNFGASRPAELVFYEGKNGQAVSGRAVKLAMMAVGQTETFGDLKDIFALSVQLKNRARTLIGNPAAKWSGRSTTKGVRVTRIA